MSYILINDPNNGLTNICVGIYFKGGMKYEDECSIGFSHIISHLTTKKIKDYEYDDLEDELYSMGIVIETKVTKSYIGYLASIKPCFFNKFVDLFFNIFSTVVWTEEDIDIVINEIKDEIEDEQENIFDYIVRSNYFNGSCYDKNVVDLPLFMKTVNKSNLLHFKELLININNCVIVLTGNYSNNNLEYLKRKIDIIQSDSASLQSNTNLFPRYFNRRKKNLLIIPSDDIYSNIEIRVDVPQELNISMSDMLLYVILFENNVGILSKIIKRIVNENVAIDYRYNQNLDFSFFSISFYVENIFLEKVLEEFFASIIETIKSINKRNISNVIKYVFDLADTKDTIYKYNYYLFKEYIFNRANILSPNGYIANCININELKSNAKKMWQENNISLYIENNSQIVKIRQIEEVVKKGLSHLHNL